MSEKLLAGIVSLGCDKNLLDSEVMSGLLCEAGFETTDELSRADVIVLNTCGFIEAAVAEGLETAMGLLEYKKRSVGRCKAFIMTGCMPTRFRKELFDELPGLDAIVGASDYDSIAEVAKRALKGEKTAKLNDISREVSDEVKRKRRLSTGHYAYLKIAEGCDNHCTYCAIPGIRGKYRSRNMESLISEAEELAVQGVKELILVAQDTLLYGNDLYGEPRIEELLQELERINGIEWLRLLYCYPERVTDKLIAEYKRNEKLCRYIDIPIQHIADNVLKRMGRKFGRTEVLGVIDKLRAELPGIAVRTTMIAGFPGETPKEHREALDFIREYKLERLGAFAYSREKDTPADLLDGHIGQKEREKRAAALMEAQAEVSLKLNEKLIGSELELIIDGKLPEEENIYLARSRMDAPGVDNTVFVSSVRELSSGDIVRVKISEAGEYDLFGELI